MRVAVISDVHGNWHALRMALLDARRNGAEVIWCLGDVVGYGPDPLRCWQELAKFRRVPMSAWVAGNHDWGLLGRLEATWFLQFVDGLDGNHVLIGDFGEHAWDVIVQHREVLEQQTALLTWFKQLPILASPVSGVYLAHGILDADTLDAIGTYAYWPELAEQSLNSVQAMLPSLAEADQAGLAGLPRLAEAGWAAPKLMLVGHTHKACVWQPRNGDHDGSRWADFTAEIAGGTKWFDDLERRPVFANPGSVGFPRDGQANLATYLLVDWEEQRVGLRLRRVPYDPTDTVKAMKAAGTNEVIYRRIEACIQVKA